MQYSMIRTSVVVLLFAAVFACITGCEKPRHKARAAAHSATNRIAVPEIGRERMIGRWSFPGGDTLPGTIDVFKDGTFIFTGWRTADFVSKGRWEFDAANCLLTLRFYDNRPYWASQMDLGTNRFRESRGVLKLDPARAEITMLIRRSWRGEQLFFNFLGWNFIRTNK